MCDRRELDKLREQRDDAITRGVAAKVAAQRFAGRWVAIEEENRELRANLAATLDELAATCALLAELTGQ